MIKLKSSALTSAAKRENGSSAPLSTIEGRRFRFPAAPPGALGAGVAAGMGGSLGPWVPGSLGPWVPGSAPRPIGHEFQVAANVAR